MKLIVVGTNRPGSNSEKIALYIQQLYKAQGEATEILRLTDVPFAELHGQNYGNKNLPEGLKTQIDRINSAEGLIMVVPEYNGSYPGALKLFIDHWSYPLSFEHRPVCFVGLGGLFGGLRPVEHLQQVFGYRNAFCFPDRIFLMNVWKIIDAAGQISDTVAADLLKKQVSGFQKFVKGLKEQELIAPHSM